MLKASSTLLFVTYVNALPVRAAGLDGGTAWSAQSELSGRVGGLVERTKQLHHAATRSARVVGMLRTKSINRKENRSEGQRLGQEK